MSLKHQICKEEAGCVFAVGEPAGASHTLAISGWGHQLWTGSRTESARSAEEKCREVSASWATF